MKRLMAILLSVMMLMLSIGCGGGGKKETKIGVAMPTQVRQRWNQDGANIEKNLIEQGYQVDLQFADNDTGTQISQINKMIKDGCKVIIIASVDANSLSEVLDKAKAAGCKVIAYDRLIMNTDAVDYYATFDNVAVGTMQAEYIEDKLGLKEGKGPFNMEIMAGSLDDSNAVSLYEGSMDVLRPYLKNGQLVVLSGQEALQDCAIPHWEDKRAQERMDNILKTYYGDAHLDAILCANDSMAYGTLSALKENGYGDGGEPLPILTGQDCDKKNLAAILKSEQTMSIFKDTRTLAEQTVNMVNAIIRGKEPETNDIGNYNNGMKVVPTFLVRPQFADKDNYKAVLIDSGYYKESDIGQ